jgi:hypothetical protein
MILALSSPVRLGQTEARFGISTAPASGLICVTAGVAATYMLMGTHGGGRAMWNWNLYKNRQHEKRRQTVRFSGSKRTLSERREEMHADFTSAYAPREKSEFETSDMPTLKHW